MPLPLQVRRVMLFARDLDQMTDFYHKTLGLAITNQSDGFVDLDGGGCRIALHRSASANPGAAKICFYSEDVGAARTALADRGIKFGQEILGEDGLRLCNFADPEGNKLQLSNRA